MLGRGVVRAAKAAAPLRGGGSHPPHPKWVWSPAGGWQWQDVWSPVCAPSPLIHPTTIRTAGSSLLGQRAGGADGPARILAMASDRTENLWLDACCRVARAPERYAADRAGVITISMRGGGGNRASPRLASGACIPASADFKSEAVMTAHNARKGMGAGESWKF